MWKAILFLFCAAFLVRAQTFLPSVVYVTTDPTGTCGGPGTALQFNYTNGDLSGCEGAIGGPYTWSTIGGGGGGGGTPGGSTGQVQYKVNGTTFGGFTLSGDCTLNTGTGAITCTKTGGVAFAPSATTDTTNASNISSGTLAAARGGAGAVNGALKGNGAGAVSQAACADLSNAAASCSTDATNASNISSGTLAAARGGAGAVNGIMKANGSGAVSAATSGTDYAPATTGTSGQAATVNGAGGFGTSINVANANFATTSAPTYNVAGTTTCNWATSNTCTVTMAGGNSTIAFSNPATGSWYQLVSIQDGTGGRSYTAFPAACIGCSQPDTVANNKSLQMLYYDGTNYQGLGLSCPLCTWGDSSLSVAPVTPATGLRLWSDSTALTFQSKNTAGNIASMVFTASGATTNQFVTYVDAVGVQHTAQPSASNLSDGTTGSGNIVLANSPTIATPSIASFVNATHTHATNAQGGQLDNTAVKSANEAGSGSKFVMANALGSSGNCVQWGAVGLTDSGSTNCGGGGGSGGGAWGIYSGTSLTVSGTQYFPIGGGGLPSGTEVNVDLPAPSAATISKFYAETNVAVGVGTTLTLTFRQNAGDTAITCAIAGASATTCNDTTHSFNPASADALAVKLVVTGTPIVGTINLMFGYAIGTSSVGTTSVSFTGGLISVATPTTTPALTVAGTSGGIPYFNSTSTWASSALLVAHGVMIGGGSGSAPVTTSAGTAGQVLTSNGASSDPTFQASGTGPAAVVGTILGTFLNGATAAANRQVWGSSTSVSSNLLSLLPFPGWIVNNTVATQGASGTSNSGGVLHSAFATFDALAGAGSRFNFSGGAYVLPGQAAGGYIDSSAAGYLHVNQGSQLVSMFMPTGTPPAMGMMAARFVADVTYPSILVGGAGGTAFTASANNFLGFGQGSATPASVELNVAIPIPFALTAQYFSICGHTAPAAAVTVTLNKNGVTQAITDVIPTATGTPYCMTDLTHTVAFAVGDYMDVEAVTGGTTQTIPDTFMLGLTPSSGTPNLIYGVINGTVTTTQTYSAPLAASTSTTYANVPLTMPYTCTASRLYVVQASANAGGVTTTFALYKNGSSTALTGTVTNGSGTGVLALDNSDTVALAAGDTVALGYVTGSGTSGTIGGWAFQCQ